MENNPSFRLENIVKEKDNLVDFEGPLSLILMLLQKNRIEIRDLKISEILEQYLEFIDKMETLDLEVASEFIQMASYLILIKTKELLSSTEEVSELEILMESLEQLKAKGTLTQLKAVIPELGARYKTGSLIYSKPQELLEQAEMEYQYKHDPVDLLKALRSVFMNNKEQVYDVQEIEKAMPKRITYSVKSKSKQIISRLRMRDISLEELYSECKTTSEIVATFVSVLELCSHGNIIVSHSKDGTTYELSLTDGNVEEIIEKIELEYE